jgi:WD40 repeat protein
MNTAPTPKQIAVIPVQRQLSLIRYTPNGEFLFGAGRDGKIHRWDFRTPAGQPAPDTTNGTADGKPAAPAFPELPALAGHDGWVTHIAFSAQRPAFFSADSWGRLIGWTLAVDPPQPAWNLASAHDGWIRQVALSPDGERLATCGKDRALRIWSTSDGTLIQEFPNQPEDMYSVAFHPDGKSLVTGDLKGLVKQWELVAATVAREFDARAMYLLHYIQDVGGVRGLTFDAGGKILAVAGAQPTSGGFVQAIPLLKFFDWTDGHEIQSLKLGENTLGYVQDLAWHPDGYWLGVCSGQPGQGSYFLHRTGEEKPFFTHSLPNCHSVALAPNGKQCAVISNAGTFGQMKSMAREGNYPGNTSPIHVFELVGP